MNQTSKEARVAIVAEWKASGQNIAEVCRNRGLEPKRLYHWTRQEREVKSKVQKDSVGPPAGFARVQTGVTVSVELRSGLRLTVAVEGLRAVLRELGAAQ